MTIDLFETTREIAKFMPGWCSVFETHSKEVGELVTVHTIDSSARIVRESDGALIRLYLDGERIEISAGWPAYSDGTRYRPDEYLKITVGAKRTPEAIATEIEKRLLPKYLPAYAKALSFIKDREAEQAATLACAERLGAILGATVAPNGRGGFGLYERLPDCIQIHVRSGGRIDIEVSAIDEVTAARILTLLKKREEAMDEAEGRDAAGFAVSATSAAASATAVEGSGKEE